MLDYQMWKFLRPFSGNCYLSIALLLCQVKWCNRDLFGFDFLSIFGLMLCLPPSVKCHYIYWCPDSCIPVELEKKCNEVLFHFPNGKFRNLANLTARDTVLMHLSSKATKIQVVALLYCYKRKPRTISWCNRKIRTKSPADFCCITY